MSGTRGGGGESAPPAEVGGGCRSVSGVEGLGEAGGGVGRLFVRFGEPVVDQDVGGFAVDLGSEADVSEQRDGAQQMGDGLAFVGEVMFAEVVDDLVAGEGSALAQDSAHGLDGAGVVVGGDAEVGAALEGLGVHRWAEEFEQPAEVVAGDGVEGAAMEPGADEGSVVEAGCSDVFGGEAVGAGPDGEEFAAVVLCLDCAGYADGVEQVCCAWATQALRGEAEFAGLGGGEGGHGRGPPLSLRDISPR